MNGKKENEEWTEYLTIFFHWRKKNDFFIEYFECITYLLCTSSCFLSQDWWTLNSITCHNKESLFITSAVGSKEIRIILSENIKMLITSIRKKKKKKQKEKMKMNPRRSTFFFAIWIQLKMWTEKKIKTMCKVIEGRR